MIIVSSRRPDGTEKYSWPAEVLAQDDNEIVVVGVFDRDHRLGPCDIVTGDTTVEHYPFDRWYNICKIYRSGNLLGTYCNLAAPPELAGSVLSFVDLELDLFVRPDGTYTVLDLQEFKRLAATALSPETVQAAMADWSRLIAQVEEGRDP